MTDTPDYVAYVLMRNDLPSMNPGKAMAQSHHLGFQLMAKHRDRLMVQKYEQAGLLQGADHFNTTLVLGASKYQIRQIQEQVRDLTDLVVSHEVVDPSYPFFVENTEIADLIPQTDQVKLVAIMGDGRVLMTRPELTCAGFVGDRNDPEFRDLFAHLSLHP